MASTPRGHETRSHETRSRGTQHIEPACATSPDLFLHPLLEDPPADVAADPTLAARLDDLLRAGRTACAACPLFAECLYAAVVHRDVAGFVACTTPAERAGYPVLARHRRRGRGPRRRRGGARGAPSARPRGGAGGPGDRPRRLAGVPRTPARLLVVDDQAAPAPRPPGGVRFARAGGPAGPPDGRSAHRRRRPGRLRRRRPRRVTGSQGGARAVPSVVPSVVPRVVSGVAPVPVPAGRETMAR